MSRFSVTQLRSGEGWILTRFSNVGPEVVPESLPDLLVGPLLVASDAFETWTPPGGEQVEAHLYAFSGEAARAMLRDASRWGRDRAIFACVPRLPDADARRRWIAQALRPWDAERLGASVYGQLGRRLAMTGLWLAREDDRRRLVEAAVTRVLAGAGCALPNGDVTIVLELPTDSTFEADFDVSGRGETFRLDRELRPLGVTRRWTIRHGEWEATERPLRGRDRRSVRHRFVQGVASAGVIALSVPVFVMVAALALVTRLFGTSSSASSSAPPTARS